MDPVAPRFPQDIAVLIPAFNPGPELPVLVKQLAVAGALHILVVDDGSDASTQAVFAAVQEHPGCSLLVHPSNLGKGRALKTGLTHLGESYPNRTGIAGVVTADADGQHLPHDILRVACALAARPDSLILGVRSFHGPVPLRSAVGNHLTKALFAAIVGSRLVDTQTGLRGIPTALIPALIAVKGDRYEYEMNVLVASKTLNVPLIQVPIATVYEDGNRSSHFRPLWDSMSIYAVLARFVLSSLLASALDLLLFASLLRLQLDLGTALIGARSLSAVFYLFLKKEVVFHSRRSAVSILPPYILLVAAMVTVSSLLLALARSWGWQDVLTAKIAIECLLFWLSFIAQRDLVFRAEPRARIASRPA